MKHFIKGLMLLLLALSPILGNGQTCDFNEDFESGITNWQIRNIRGGSPATTSTLSSLTVSPQGGSSALFFNNSQSYDVNNPAFGYDIRAFRRLDQTLCESWIASGDFRITANNGGLISHILFAATENSQHPTYDVNRNITNNSGLHLYVNGGSWNDFLQRSMFLRLDYKDGTQTTTLLVTPDQSINLNQDYSYRLERIRGGFGELTVFAGQTEIFNGCFQIPNNDTASLRWIQASNNPHAAAQQNRQGSLYIDNLCIQNCEQDELCCEATEIIGPDVLCQNGEGLVANYTVNDDGQSTYQWSILGEFDPRVTLTSNGNNATLNVASGFNRTIVLQVTISCGCYEYTLTKTITVYDLTNVSQFTWQTSNSPVNQIEATSTVSDPTLSWTWNLYQADNCISQDVTISTNNPNPVESQIGGNIFTANDNGNGLAVGCYVLVQTVSSDGACAVENRWKFIDFTGGKFVPSSGTSILYNPQLQESSSMESAGRSSLGLSVSPNPSSYSIEVEHSFVNGIGKYYVIDMQGNLILSGNCSSEASTLIGVNELVTGSYIIRVEDQHQSRSETFEVIR